MSSAIHPGTQATGDRRDEPSGRGGFAGWWRRNDLAIVCLALFLVFLAGQAVTGWHVYNEANEEHGGTAVTFGSYLTTGHFVEATFENWESEFLQMAAFVLLTVFLVEKGSPQSRSDGDSGGNSGGEQSDDDHVPWPVRRGGLWRVLYENSLVLAFLVLFLLSIAGHALGGAHEYDDDRESHGQPAVSTLEFVATSDFWFQSFQNWQSEFLAVASITVLTIFLRQKGSPQSKPVPAPRPRATSR